MTNHVTFNQSVLKKKRLFNLILWNKTLNSNNWEPINDTIIPMGFLKVYILFTKERRCNSLPLTQVCVHSL